MPLVEIRVNFDRVPADALLAITKELTWYAAASLSCAEGGVLQSEDIMIEVNEHGSLDVNNKDLHIRVWAHDYPSRRSNLDEIRKLLSKEVKKHLPNGLSWYVWVLLAPTSYGSDTEEK